MNAATALAGLAAAFAVSAQGKPSSLAMLDRLDSGNWEMRNRDDGEVSRICLENGRRLIQLRHQGAKCDRVVIEDGPNQVTVQYTCPGRGYGRTQIRYETSRLVQIDSQGIANGLPFAFAAEARRVGDCSP